MQKMSPLSPSSITLKLTITLIFLVNFCKLPLVVVALEQDLSDFEYIEKYDEVASKVACEAMSASDPELYKLDLTRPITYQDVTKLTFMNKGLQLSTNMIQFPEDIAWKRKLVNTMFNIWLNYCPDTYVNHGYMKIMRELIMIYINSLEVRTTESMDVWEAIIKSLEQCEQREASVYNFTHIGYHVQGIIMDIPNNDADATGSSSFSSGSSDNGGKVDDGSSQLLAGRVDISTDGDGDDGFVVEASAEDKTGGAETSPDGGGGDGGDGTGGEVAETTEAPPPAPPSSASATREKELYPLMPQKDAANAVFELDLIIENFWAVFSQNWATCYPKAPSRQLWGPRFKQLFFRDFLEPLEERWKQPGPLMYYLDLIMGDVEVSTIQHNIPFCTDAAYLSNGDGMFELVRPIKLAEISEGAEAFQNHQVN